MVNTIYQKSFAALMKRPFRLWGISLPLAFLGAYVFMLPVPLVLALMKLDEPAKAILCLIHLRRGKWLKVVTRDFDDGGQPCLTAETAV